MIGIGTLINVAAIVAGGLIGMLAGNILKENIRDALMKVNGVAVLFVGISGVIEKMAQISDGKISMNGSIMMIVTLCIGTVIGEILDIEGGFERFGEWLKRKSGNASDVSFVSAFVTASFTVCIGAMAIVGSIEDGLHGNYTILLTKAILDFTIIMIMTASLGKGCIFSAIPVGILQWTVTLLAVVIAPLMSDAALTNLSLVGNVLIFCVGYNLIHSGTFKVANMLPAVLIAVIWAMF